MVVTGVGIAWTPRRTSYGEGDGATIEPSPSLRPMQCQQVLAAVAGPVAVQKAIART